MARPRRTPIDTLLDLYLDLSPEERPFTMAAIRGAERALGVRKPDTDEEEAGKDLGESAAQEKLPGVKA